MGLGVVVVVVVAGAGAEEVEVVEPVEEEAWEGTMDGCGYLV